MPRKTKPQQKSHRCIMKYDLSSSWEKTLLGDLKRETKKKQKKH